MNLTLLGVGVKGRIQASASLSLCSGALLQGTRPRDHRGWARGLGQSWVSPPPPPPLPPGVCWRAPSPNTVSVGLRAGFRWVCVFLSVLLPAGGGGHRLWVLLIVLLGVWCLQGLPRPPPTWAGDRSAAMHGWWLHLEKPLSVF